MTVVRLWMTTLIQAIRLKNGGRDVHFWSWGLVFTYNLRIPVIIMSPPLGGGRFRSEDPKQRPACGEGGEEKFPTFLVSAVNGLGKDAVRNRAHINLYLLSRGSTCYLHDVRPDTGWNMIYIAHHVQTISHSKGPGATSRKQTRHQFNIKILNGWIYNSTPSLTFTAGLHTLTTSLF
jgi:hypothetical protein